MVAINCMGDKGHMADHRAAQGLQKTAPAHQDTAAPEKR